MHAALIAATIANTQRTKQTDRVAKVQDYMYDGVKQSRNVIPQEKWADYFESLTRRMGGKVLCG